MSWSGDNGGGEVSGRGRGRGGRTAGARRVAREMSVSMEVPRYRFCEFPCECRAPTLPLV